MQSVRIGALVALVASLIGYYIYMPFQTKELPGRWTNDRQRAIVEAAYDTWQDYRKYGFGSDSYGPITKWTDPPNQPKLGWMIVDSLDTFMLMGLDEFKNESRAWIENNLNYDIDLEVNLFETTIRMLGGLLGAYHQSGGDELYLQKAVDLADRLIVAFDTPSKIPTPDVNLRKGQVLKHNQRISSTAEVTTLQLEFKYLSYLTKDRKYWDAVQQVMKRIKENKAPDGLVPIFLNSVTGKFVPSEIRLGSRGDSYYEYLQKQYMQTNRTEPVFKEMYDEAVLGIRRNLLGLSEPSNFLFIGERPRGLNGPFSPKMDHLVCFAGAMFALGATEGNSLADSLDQEWWSEARDLEFRIGAELTKSCVSTYFGTQTGLAPEIVVFSQDPHYEYDFYIKPADLHNLQRPETVESLMVLYHLTGDEHYREWGWAIFESFRKHSRLRNGAFSSLENVNTGEKRDLLESFWLAETLKYLYLLFEDEEKVDFTKIVFNTEAHAFPIIPLTYDTWN